MSDRYRYPPRARSPTYNPARSSLPINLSGYGHPAAHEHHLHVVPIGTSRREPSLSSGHSRSTTSSNAGTITTTYKIKPEPPPLQRASSHTRNDSQTRRRSATVENTNRPTVVTTVTKHRPVVHSSGGRAPSPAMKAPYRSSEEEFYTAPGYSQHGHHHRHSVDHENTGRMAPDRDGNRLRIGSIRQEASHNANRPRSSMHPIPIARHTDAVADDYGDDGYGYTNPRDLVTYDLNNTTRSHLRNNSFGEGSRPSSISGYGDLLPRSYETRERGPPPTTRGFDRIPRGATWEQPATARMPVIAPLPVMEPVHRPAKVEPYEQSPARRNSAQRPVSLYHDRDRERRRDSRDDYYEARDEQPRHHRRESATQEVPRFEDPIEQRGFGIRAEAPPPRPERPDRLDRPEMSERTDRGDRLDKPERVGRSDRERLERLDRPEILERTDRGDRLDKPERVGRSDRERHERSERSGRQERSERADKPERYDRTDRSERERPDWTERPERSERSEWIDDRKDKSGRDLLTTSLGIAGAALGLNSIKKARDESRDDRERDREDREDREERRRKDYEDQPRRRREPREDRNSPDSSDREPKERWSRDDDRERAPPKPSRENVPPIPPKEPISSRDQPRDAPGDMPPPRDISPEKEKEARERNSDTLVLDLNGRNPEERSSTHSGRPARESDPELRERRRRDGPSGSDESLSKVAGGFHHQRPVKESVSSPTVFNPKDTMDLRALKEALNQQENTVPKENAPAPAPKVSRSSIVRDAAETEALRSELKEERRSREPLAVTENLQQPRVVSPPRQKIEDKPVKGILRQPREKFPEDPSPIREGVAPLKDAKKDGVPPDARWTKISRNLVNPEALELGKERYEARDDFVIVLRVLSRDEVQGYAEVTQKLRAAREDAEEEKARDERRRARRERHERHKRERNSGERAERTAERPRRRREREPRESESDTTEDDIDPREREPEKPKMLALEPAPPRRRALSNSGGSTRNRFDDVMMSGGLSSGPPPIENPNVPGQYLNYTRNPPPPTSMVAQSSGTSRRDRN